MGAGFLHEKTAFITGANTGIGLETARALAMEGATVIVGARNVLKGERAVREIRHSAKHDRVSLQLIDLADLASVRAAAAQILEDHPRLDILVNNAGLILSDRRLTKDGFEGTFGINHLGPFLLTELLLPRLKASAPARIINVSSGAHRGAKGLNFDDLMFEKTPYKSFPAYSASKLANILHARALTRRLEGTRVTANALHPGFVATSFGQDGDLPGWMMLLFPLFLPFTLTPFEGAQTSIYLATSPEVEGVSGHYFEKSRDTKPTGYALDDEAAERLYVLSRQLVGLPAEA